MSWPPGAHASTFGGNPVACAAATTTIELLKEQLIANAATVGEYLMDGVRELQKKHAIIGDVRGKGLMIGIELVKDRQTKERAVEERNAVVQAAFRRGVLILGAGKNAIRLAPPLVFTRGAGRQRAWGARRRPESDGRAVAERGQTGAVRLEQAQTSDRARGSHSCSRSRAS